MGMLSKNNCWNNWLSFYLIIYVFLLYLLLLYDNILIEVKNNREVLYKRNNFFY